MDLGRVYLHRFRSERAALFLSGLPRGAVGHTRVRVAGRGRSPAHQGTAGADPSPGQGASSFAARGHLFSARQTGPGRGVLSRRPGAGSRGHRHAFAPWPVPAPEKETGGSASAAGESVRREPEARLRAFADGFGGNASRFGDRKSTRLNSSHGYISYAVFCLKKKNRTTNSVRNSRYRNKKERRATRPNRDLQPLAASSLRPQIPASETLSADTQAATRY